MLLLQRRSALVLGVLILACGLVGGALALGQGAKEKAAGLKVVVTVPPFKGLVEPLLPVGSSVTVLMKPGRSEHGYEFTPADMAALAGADVFVYIGLGLEPRIEAALAKKPAGSRQIVCFAEVVGYEQPGGPKAAGQGEVDSHDHHHDDAHDHDHDKPDAIDPHLWLDPVLVEKLIPALHKAVKAAATARAPASAAEVARLDLAERTLIERVHAVDSDWTAQLAPFKGAAIVTHHNAFKRPAERYGFKIAAAIREFEGSEPAPGDIAKVVAAIREHNVQAIFCEPQYNQVAAQRIAASAGVRLAALDPLGDGDWFKLMQTNLDSLTKNLAPSK